MFKRLKEKLAEEAKNPFGQHAFGRLPDAIAKPSDKFECYSPNENNEDLITLSESSAVIVPHSSSEQFSIADEDGSLSEQNTPEKSKAITPGGSDLFSTPKILENELLNLKDTYVLQTDIESEVEQPPTLNLEGISKEQLLTKIEQLKVRLCKYKNRYSEVKAAYKNVNEEKEKLERTLTHDQDVSLRRIAELREQCSLEQRAKAHLEEMLRLNIDEKDSRISVLETQINLLKESQSDSLINGVKHCTDVSTMPDETLIEGFSSETVQDVQSKLKNCEADIILQVEKNNQLMSENAILKEKHETLLGAISKLEEERDRLCSEHELTVKLMKEQMDELERQQEDSVMSMAETKRNMHEELELKDQQINKFKEEARLLQLTIDQEKAFNADFRKQHDDMIKDFQSQIQTMEEDKQSLLRDFKRGKSDAIALMQQENVNRIAAVEEQWKAKFADLELINKAYKEKEQELLNKLQLLEGKLHISSQNLEEAERSVELLEIERNNLVNLTEELQFKGEGVVNHGNTEMQKEMMLAEKVTEETDEDEIGSLGECLHYEDCIYCAKSHESRKAVMEKLELENILLVKRGKKIERMKTNLKKVCSMLRECNKGYSSKIKNLLPAFSMDKSSSSVDEETVSKDGDGKETTFNIYQKSKDNVKSLDASNEKQKVEFFEACEQFSATEAEHQNLISTGAPVFEDHYKIICLEKEEEFKNLIKEKDDKLHDLVVAFAHLYELSRLIEEAVASIILSSDESVAGVEVEDVFETIEQLHLESITDETKRKLTLLDVESRARMKELFDKTEEHQKELHLLETLNKEPKDAEDDKTVTNCKTLTESEYKDMQDFCTEIKHLTFSKDTFAQKNKDLELQIDELKEQLEVNNQVICNCRKERKNVNIGTEDYESITFQEPAENGCVEDIYARTEIGLSVLSNDALVEKGLEQNLQIRQLKEQYEANNQINSNFRRMQKDVSVGTEDDELMLSFQDLAKNKRVEDVHALSEIEDLQFSNAIFVHKNEELVHKNEELKLEIEELRKELGMDDQNICDYKTMCLHLKSKKDALKKRNLLLQEELAKAGLMSVEKTDQETQIGGFDDDEELNQSKELLQANNEDEAFQIMCKRNEEKMQFLEDEVQSLRTKIRVFKNDAQGEVCRLNASEHEAMTEQRCREIELVEREKLADGMKLEVTDVRKQMQDVQEGLQSSNDFAEEKEYDVNINASENTIAKKDMDSEKAKKHFEMIIEEKNSKIRELEMKIGLSQPPVGTERKLDDVCPEPSDWDDTWVETVENPLECESCNSQKNQLHTMQEELAAQNLELNKLRKMFCNDCLQNRHTHHSAKGPDNVTSENMQMEYLRNVLFQYMMGTETETLARVIATILNFTDEQRKHILEKEQSKHLSK